MIIFMFQCTRASAIGRRLIPVTASTLGVLAAVALAPGAAPHAAATPACADVEVVFARGTDEAPGAGSVGTAFVDALRAQVTGKTVDSYAVNYPASNNWPTVVLGVNDAADHIRTVAADCPDTSIVLGGYSQGAAVAQLVTADPPAIPPNSFAHGTTTELSADIAERVDAVLLFGKPNDRMLFLIGQPNVPIGTNFVSKTLDLCAINDAVCSDGLDPVAHQTYIVNGMVTEAATYAAARI
ncbi:cutinase family protein [Mycolicibacterium neoaurum]|uniref:cutinase family protein n=1 Tax=Mycolicibacterium neoaurum TaxID=1795 RepID=UPI002673604D|nr:cutinase family protein [Mycolicibacterium neoaurum]MDO3399222.1 cutinase family protein [Mycolicibacterium neoaurum]